MEQKTKDLLFETLIILGVIAFGFFALNQFSKFAFNVQVLYDPCGFCLSQDYLIQDPYTGQIFNRSAINWSNVNLSNLSVASS